MEGTKETMEALEALKAVTLLVVSKVKDGVDLQDGMDVAGALLLDGELKGKLESAVEGIDKIDDEFKDLDLAEGLELAKWGMDMAMELVEALKKEEA